MKIFLEILNIILPVFLVIGVGFSIRRTGLLDRNFLFQLNKLLFYLGLPLLLFYKIATADFETSFNLHQVLALLLATLLGFILSYGYAALKRYPPRVRGTFSQACFRGNLAYMGLAIIYNAYGEQGLASGGVLLGFVVVALNFFSIIALLMPYGKAKQQDQSVVKFMTHQIVVNPLIIACFIGIIWSSLKIPVPQVLDRGLHIITGMTLPLALLSIGGSFSPQKIRGDFTKTILAIIFKLLIFPALTAAILLTFGVYGQDLAIGIIFAGCPTAAAAYIMAQQMKGDEELSGAIIMLSTLLSAFTFTLSLWLLKMMGI